MIRGNRGLGHSHHGLQMSANAEGSRFQVGLTLLQNSTRGLGHESYIVSGRPDTLGRWVVTWRLFRPRSASLPSINTYGEGTKTSAEASDKN